MSRFGICLNLVFALLLLAGVLAPGKTFRKSLRMSQTIQEVDEEKWKESRGDGVIFSRDSLEPNGSSLICSASY